MRNAPLGWICTFIAFFGLLLPSLVQQGMFLDGVTYACISRNMANGLGAFALWKQE